VLRVLARIRLYAIAATLAVSPAASRAQKKQPTVEFLAPLELAPGVRSALEEALATHLALIPATLRFSTNAAGKSQPGERLHAAKRIAAASGAIGVFWLDANAGEPWLLYAVDARSERMLVRQLASTPASEYEAAIEAVALLVRATTRALLHGEPLAPSSEEASTPSAQSAPWPVELLDAGESALRIAVAFVATTFSAEQPVQPGIALRAAWLWPSGTYVGLGFSVVETAVFDVPPIRFELERHPISLHAGLRFGFSRVTLSGELGAELEVRARRTISAADLEPTRDEQRVVYNICPKLEVEFAVTPWLVTFLNTGLDFVLDNFAYSRVDEATMTTTTVAQPHWVRFTLQVGIGVIR